MADWPLGTMNVWRAFSISAMRAASLSVVGRAVDAVGVGAAGAPALVGVGEGVEDGGRGAVGRRGEGAEAGGRLGGAVDEARAPVDVGFVVAALSLAAELRMGRAS